MDQTVIGVVVIGRNEGERLRACLSSLRHVDARVYVDSGSTDGSCALARSLGFAVVELDQRKGFTAARARNAGIEWLAGHYPHVSLVQTVDGDCEVQRGWLAAAERDLAADSGRAVVFGRRRERDAARNAYHLVCDDEWDIPVGEVSSCGGDALFRMAALREVKGYNSDLIAGEEPDMCLRLREKGWKIWSSGDEMTSHDVSINCFQQYWKRSRRTGFAIAQLVDIHRERADRNWRRLMRSALAWTFLNLTSLPLGLALIFLGKAQFSVMALAPPLLSCVQIIRLAIRKRNSRDTWSAMSWAILIMAAKPPQALGWMQYKLRKLSCGKLGLIEYKQYAPPAE